MLWQDSNRGAFVVLVLVPSGQKHCRGEMHSLEEQCDATLPSQPRSRCHLSVPEALEVHLMHITACLGSSPSSGRGWGLQPHSGLGQDVSMPLEGTCDMWESFQVFPGTGRKMTFNFFSAPPEKRVVFPVSVSPTGCKDHPCSWTQTHVPRLSQWLSSRCSEVWDTNRMMLHPQSPSKKAFVAPLLTPDASSNLEGEQFQRSSPIILFQEGNARLMFSTTELNMIADFSWSK